MNRREFIVTTLGSCVMEIAKGKPAGRKSLRHANGDEKQLAGMSLTELRDQYRHDLFDDCLPLMDKYVVDHQYGGFLCNVNSDGTHPDEIKETWFLGRGTWVYAFLYNHFGKNPQHLEVARGAVDLILKAKPSGEDELWPASLTREGKPLTPPATTIYGDVFIAEGLAEYSKATADSQYWDLAKQILLKCLRVYNRAEYDPDVVREYSGPEPIRFPGARIQGVAMVLIRTLTQMLAMHPDAELESVVADQVRAVTEKHFNPEFRLNNELLNHDYSRPTNELAQFVYTGHSIETLWMIVYEAARREDRRLFEIAAERFRRHAAVAWDEVYGGGFRSLDNVDENRWQLDKALWLQEELMNGSLFVLEQTGADWARELYARTYHYVRSTYFVQRLGYSFWISYGDRKVVLHPNLTRVENYHHPRHLMLSLFILDRMIRQQGKAATLFASTGSEVVS